MSHFRFDNRRKKTKQYRWKQENKAQNVKNWVKAKHEMKIPSSWDWEKKGEKKERKKMKI